MSDVIDLGRLDPVLAALAAAHGAVITVSTPTRPDLRSVELVHRLGEDDGLPAAMPHLRLHARNGKVVGQVLLGPDIAYVVNGETEVHTLHIKQTVTQDLADDLVGRPVSDMIEVPGISRWTIARTRRGAGTIELSIEPPSALIERHPTTDEGMKA